MNAEFGTLCEVLQHQSRVRANIAEMRAKLELRGIRHDMSKLDAEEFDVFASTHEQFKTVNYNTPEYAECVRLAKPAVDAHYAKNSHHTAHYANGFADMSLFDIMEMLADWLAASVRSPDLTFVESLPAAFDRYDIPINMRIVILNTLIELGWIHEADSVTIMKDS